jgi:hypothetical protein
VDEALLIARYRRRGLILDTNLLLVYCIGRYDRRLIGTLPRLDDYSQEDFDVLAHLVGNITPLIATPNILTEVSNLALSALARRSHYPFLTVFAAIIDELIEELVSSRAVTPLASFARLGLTDATIEQAASDRYLVISADLPLVIALQTAGVAALNFNHLREMTWSAR